MIKRGTAARLGLRLPCRTGGLVRGGMVLLVGEHGCESFTTTRGGVVTRGAL